MSRIIFWVKFCLLFFWLFACSLVGIFRGLIFWRDPDNSLLFARLWAWGSRILFGFQIEYTGVQNIPKNRSCIFIGNHQSGLDLTTFGKIYPRGTLAIGKKELIWIPVFGIFFWLGGNILIDRKKGRQALDQLLEVANECKKRGHSLWLFPEGTRNPQAQGLLPFKKGAFAMARDADLQIVPFLSSPLKEVFDWKTRTLVSKAKIQVSVLPPINPLLFDSVESLQEHCFETMRSCLESPAMKTEIYG